MRTQPRRRDGINCQRERARLRRSAQLYLGRALSTVVAVCGRRRSEYKVARAARVPVAWGSLLTRTVDSRPTAKPAALDSSHDVRSRGGFLT
ncbi:uncharacterized protein TRAVEDRAFT_59190 [Trametes versicolor FP-101664 SS1]|uniref:uncharacterized protein n=1 Tax=Trametes versicolor (strain FP-101664) TaxID=717944 RepID=UPI00046235AF|nr:uncharacterized protein TRAVEDRAFT_59190 [Trametes versicolor FP-101664 SS1]EIW57533.1 hypothetical protein TRAVEDRAFT_59190 [Trametes versicolor FP-101664 SS1]